jgi:hypothetical protein
MIIYKEGEETVHWWNRAYHAGENKKRRVNAI